MPIRERLEQFLIFIVLSVITVGVYPVYFMVSTIRERNALLIEIRTLLMEIRDEIKFHARE